MSTATACAVSAQAFSKAFLIARFQPTRLKSAEDLVPVCQAPSPPQAPHVDDVQPDLLPLDRTTNPPTQNIHLLYTGRQRVQMVNGRGSAEVSFSGLDIFEFLQWLGCMRI